jgi:hypothetical protein
VGWWILPAIVLVAGAVATLRRARELIADADDTARLAGSPRLADLSEPARLAADRMGDIGTVVGHPVALLRSARRRPWRDLRRRWSGRRRDAPTPS